MVRAFNPLRSAAAALRDPWWLPKASPGGKSRLGSSREGLLRGKAHKASARSTLHLLLRVFTCAGLQPLASGAQARGCHRLGASGRRRCKPRPAAHSHASPHPRASLLQGAGRRPAGEPGTASQLPFGSSASLHGRRREESCEPRRTPPSPSHPLPAARSPRRSAHHAPPPGAGSRADLEKPRLVQQSQLRGRVSEAPPSSCPLTKRGSLKKSTFKLKIIYSRSQFCHDLIIFSLY